MPNEIRVIQNFVNCDLYHPEREKAASRSTNGEKLLMHISNFRPVKRVLDCIRILAEVRQADAGAFVHGGRRPGSPRGASAGARTGLDTACDVPGQTGSRGAPDSAACTCC